MGTNQENHNTQTPAPKKSNRGFAAMDPKVQKEIASKGGRAAHQKGTAHEFTPEEAAAAGRKGGEASHRNQAKRAAEAARKAAEEQLANKQDQSMGTTASRDFGLSPERPIKTESPYYDEDEENLADQNLGSKLSQ